MTGDVITSTGSSACVPAKRKQRHVCALMLNKKNISDDNMPSRKLIACLNSSLLLIIAV